MKDVNLRHIKSLSKDEKYESVISVAKQFLGDEENVIANLSNIASLLKHSFDYFSWAGFYLAEDATGQLVLGPFQGKVACTRIGQGKGVCGAAVGGKKTVIVDDVNSFPGHIACDSESKSEIVVPIIAGGKIFGVLDVDSTKYASFDEKDGYYLEKLVSEISNSLK